MLNLASQTTDCTATRPHADHLAKEGIRPVDDPRAGLIACALQRRIEGNRDSRVSAQGKECQAASEQQRGKPILKHHPDNDVRLLWIRPVIIDLIP